MVDKQTQDYTEMKERTILGKNKMSETDLAINVRKQRLVAYFATHWDTKYSTNKTTCFSKFTGRNIMYS